jgi:hypothetical protein
MERRRTRFGLQLFSSWCATADVAVLYITWDSWGDASAYRKGTLDVNTCQLYYAAGHIDTYPESTISVSDPVDTSGIPVFQQVSVLPNGTAPVEMSSDPGGWGW